MTTPAAHVRRRPTASLALSLLLLAGCATQQPGNSPSLPDPQTAAPVPTPAPAAPAVAAPAPEAPIEVTTPPVPVDPIRDAPVNLDDQSAQTDLWARVRKGFAMPDLDNDLVHVHEQWYATRPDYVQRMTERGSRYMYYIVDELERRGMPTELALLPFIESAFNPQALSTAKASGMWQFIPSTGKDYDLKQNIFRDDRRDVLASTRAALDYLQKLHDMFGDWQLALAAYNWGEGSVAKAVAKNERLGLPTDYVSLRMPAETTSYVPKLQAVKNIVSHPGDFGLTLPDVANHPYFLSVPIDHDIDVALAAQLAAMPLDEFKQLNPQMNKPVILAAGTPQILLPYDNADRFVRRLTMHHGPLASWTAWVTPKTMRPAEAARQVGMTEADLRDVNRIPARMLVKAGSTLLVPRIENRHADVSGEIADNATIALAPDLPPLKKHSFKAGRKDSVASFAKRYRVSPVQLAQWNNVATNASFKPGQTVVVYLGGKAAATKPTRLAKAAPPRKAKPARVASGSPVAHATRHASPKYRVAEN
ncbi:MAG: transglycosylase SLT domain-containing protein [Proteobacteria bacterium]|nr:transglycosylase SLT domain-containing protein [Pseudomonadota bacterium]